MCSEAQSGLLVSADVAYLLSFSIIMLNTGAWVAMESFMAVSDG